MMHDQLALTATTTATETILLFILLADDIMMPVILLLFCVAILAESLADVLEKGYTPHRAAGIYNIVFCRISQLPQWDIQTAFKVITYVQRISILFCLAANYCRPIDKNKNCFYQTLHIKV